MSIQICERVLSYVLMMIQYFFVFEMSIVHHTLHSQSHQELANKLKIMKILFAVTLVLHYLQLATVIFETIVDSESSQISEETKSIIRVTGTGFGIIVNFYMLGSGAYYIQKFAVMKQENFRLEGKGSSTPFHIFAVAWGILLFLLNLMIALTNAAISLLMMTEVLLDGVWYHGWQAISFNIVIFLNCLTMIGVFYFVSRNEERRRASQVRCGT